jgi:hypothetical protein
VRRAWLLLLSTACSSSPSSETWRSLDGWDVAAGEVHLASPGAGDLYSLETYGDFELSLEWKISAGGNSGIFFRASDDRAAYETGPEMQILDDERHADGADPKTSAAANYALHAPSAYQKRPAGQWNQVRLIVRGARVEHFINGSKVVEYELGSAEWESLVAASKFADFSSYGSNSEGFIVLQDHGDEVWFRDVEIRR